jgi:hypothetical protein
LIQNVNFPTAHGQIYNQWTRSEANYFNLQFLII